MASKDQTGSQTDEPDLWTDLRPSAAIAQIFTFVAVVIYMYSLVPSCLCGHFRFTFFRQVAYILQIIRLFLLMTALLPCVLHSQVKHVFPNINGNQFAAAVIVALIGNILAAFGVRKFFRCNADALCCVWHWLPSLRSSCGTQGCCENPCCPGPNYCCMATSRTGCPRAVPTSSTCCSKSRTCRRDPFCPKATGLCGAPVKKHSRAKKTCASCPEPDTTPPCPPPKCRKRKPRCKWTS